MPRKISYKPVPKELEKMVKPNTAPSSRPSLGLEEAVGEYYYIDVNQLVPFKNQARKIFNQDAIQELANSIKEYGIRQPLTVQKKTQGQYEVISGERRLRAATLAGLTKIPCIVLKDDKNTDAIALIENIHRTDLHPIELGISYKKLIDQSIFKNQEDLSKAISVPKSTVSECIKLSALPEEIREEIIKKNIVARDKLRQVVTAHHNNDLQKIQSIVGTGKRQQKNFSIIRILSSEGKIKIQDSGILKLSSIDKEVVKQNLLKLVNKLNSI